eukprot:12420088-Karenia_brevis.AAC.1
MNFWDFQRRMRNGEIEVGTAGGTDVEPALGAGEVPARSAHAIPARAWRAIQEVDLEDTIRQPVYTIRQPPR